MSLYLEIYETVSNFFLPLNFILAFIVIFKERKSPTAVWAWLMILFFLPVLGFILYLFFGRELKNSRWSNPGMSRTRRYALEQKAHMKQTGEPSVDRTEVNKFLDLVYMQLANSDSPLTDDNKLVTYTDGQEKFDSLLADIEAATTSVHLQYYIFRKDQLGNKFLHTLIKKAKQGVKVRILYDGMGSLFLGKKFFKELIREGGEVNVFFPALNSIIKARFNHRNHRKIAVIDGKIAYTGGFNIGDEYLGRKKKYGYWRDTHLKIEGSAVHHLQDIFLMDWSKATKQEPENYHTFFAVKDSDGSVPMQIVSSGADSDWDQVKDGFLKIINHAEKYIFIQTPYFIPDDSILDSIRVAALSGVDVRIMIPNKPDHPFVYWATLSYVRELMEAGVRIYIYENGFLHAKTFVIDDAVSTIGTTNVDVRSLSLNFEVNTFIYDRKTTLQMKDIFLKDVEKSKELTHDDYYSNSLWSRFKESVSRLISPLL